MPRGEMSPSPLPSPGVTWWPCDGQMEAGGGWHALPDSCVRDEMGLVRSRHTVPSSTLESGSSVPYGLCDSPPPGRRIPSSLESRWLLRGRHPRSSGVSQPPQGKQLCPRTGAEGRGRGGGTGPLRASPAPAAGHIPAWSRHARGCVGLTPWAGWPPLAPLSAICHRGFPGAVSCPGSSGYISAGTQTGMGKVPTSRNSLIQFSLPFLA